MKPYIGKKGIWWWITVNKDKWTEFNPYTSPTCWAVMCSSFEECVLTLPLAVEHFNKLRT